MSFNLSVITHPTADILKPSLIIEDRTTGDRTIIGNVPSGLQRKCNEMHLKTSRLTSVFFSGILDWTSLAGLPGMILTISDQGVKNLDLYHSGNKIIQYMISSWRYFIFRFGLNLKAEDVKSTIKKGHVEYTPININPLSDYGNNEDKLVDYSKLDKLLSGIFPIQDDPSRPVYNSKKIGNLTLPKSIVNPKVSTNWIITPESIRGKFLVNVAKQLGCQIPHFKDLCNFKPVTLDDGTIIQPEQVLEPTRNFNPILVLDIPSEEYLQNTLSYDWKTASPNGLAYTVVYHFIDDSIVDPLGRNDYIDFIRAFGPSTTHFISHKSYCPNSLNFMKTLKVSLKWKALLPSLFPLPKWSNDTILKIDGNFSNVLPMISGQSLIINSTSGTNLVESTKDGSDVSKCTSKDIGKMFDEERGKISMEDFATKENFDLVVAENATTQSLRKVVDPTKSLKSQVETLILGTGSAIPSNLRNVLCNIVRIPYKLNDGRTGFRSIVLDAGENSFGSLRRLYHSEEVEMLLDEMKLIYLSHLHADHHLGIIDFIREWNYRQVSKYGNSRYEKLFIVTPGQYEKFMNELNRVDPFIDQNFIKHVSCDEFMVGYITPSSKQLEIETIPLDQFGSIPNIEVEYEKDDKLSAQVYNAIGMRDISTCSAYHCEFSYSCSLSFKLHLESDDISDENVFKVSYSGDTRPKATFAYIGKNSDLLIHESTLEDEKLKDAVNKRHSTTSEALQVGILMKAKKIILTHFSQRYKSFTCSELIYKRLDNPTTRSDVVATNSDITIPTPPSPTSSPKEIKDYQFALYSNTELPVEVKSDIFNEPLDESMKNGARNLEVLFAFDNMKVEYDEMHKQRCIFENHGEQLELIFNEDEEVVEDDDSVGKLKKVPSNDNKNQAKKNATKTKSNKKRRITSPVEK